MIAPCPNKVQRQHDSHWHAPSKNVEMLCLSMQRHSAWQLPCSDLITQRTD